ncbi:phosphoribosylformylglycinamidine synthase I [archaeon]|jgi:phosphoribosylformylglycinamidine synthase|nr:phosphoribosylformylglycinamidine synthase I [archaeon]MDP6548237.1 phosphoribosylformylglycinamidine synthase I [Candidatus Woesearchaeota archaeon]HJN57006.1 phosphoribosylformylglycinamidine synthase I [Candidatus Woesearchaeota archaeon]|tara:strand:+ start:31868 stop:32644 length:777 start_codon:yes stop_codon:yes gene_type:complete
MPKPKIAVIYFPGNNCEQETKERCIEAGMQADIIRWNSKEKLNNYDGFIIPGGFSYEDRVRAGIIAAKEKIMERIKDETKNKKPLLGICNGAQVLVETGLIPGLNNKIQMALAPNKNPLTSGYYCAWINVKNINKKSCAFNYLYENNEVIQMPIANAEGRFTTKDSALIKNLEKNRQIAFRYCNEDGKIEDSFPTNPNGTSYNISAVSNKEGNVMAMMPHPERASWQWQIPNKKKQNTKAGAFKIFESMKNYIEERVI